MKIAIYGSRRQTAVVRYISSFLHQLRRRGISVLMHPKLYDHLSDIAPDCLTDVERRGGTDFDADLVVSLGGDGTFLRTIAWVDDKQIPIVGVNTGHLGFLTALPIDRLEQLPQIISSDGLRIEQRMVLMINAPELPDNMCDLALNEVAILKDENASMIDAEVRIGGRLLTSYRADGLILCTSTGSTAYNLSVGGPIVDPALDVCVLSPVAAHSLSMRPLVTDAAHEISIVPSGRASRVRVALDGRSFTVPTGTEIKIVKAPFKVKVMQLADHSFADTLREKLHWGEN